MQPTEPEFLTSMLFTAAERDAAPPMWNVRMVSCVPGSPIDWAAMTPTASPMLTSCRAPGRARSTCRRYRASLQVIG